MKGKRGYSISIIGAGAVGSALASALHKAGYPVDTVISRRMESARKLARKVHARASQNLDDVPASQRNIIFLTVSDDAIRNLVRDLAKRKKNFSGSVVFHTSGALSSDILNPLKRRGAHVGSLHPLQAFPRSYHDPERMSKIWISLEGDPAAIKTGRHLVKALGSKSFSIDPKHKTLYHIAAVFSSNYLVTLLSVVEELGRKIKIDQGNILSIFEPLIIASVQNVKKYSAEQALTGPIARLDVNTVRKHVDALSKKEFADILSLYASLGLATARLAARKRAMKVK